MFDAELHGWYPKDILDRLVLLLPLPPLAHQLNLNCISTMYTHVWHTNETRKKRYAHTLTDDFVTNQHMSTSASWCVNDGYNNNTITTAAAAAATAAMPTTIASMRMNDVIVST